MHDLISLIVTTYNRPDALDAVLRALSRQADRNFETIIVDDGSGAETEALVAAWKSRHLLALRHIWQEDRGFRAAEARNKGIEAAQGRYCIFLDGDCLPRPDFVAVHRRLAEPGWFVAGNRVLLSQARTESVLTRGEQPERWRFSEAASQRRQGHLNRAFPLLHLPLGGLRKLRPRAWRGARSCNLAVWRDDLIAIDGFDARFNGWGKEDSDLLVRLLNAGVRRKDGNFATAVFHLYHPEADRTLLQENERRLQAVINNRATRAERGLSIRDATAPASSTGRAVS